MPSAKPRGGGGSKGQTTDKNTTRTSPTGEPMMSDEEQHYLLRVREVISRDQLSDDKVLTILHDNGNDVALLTSNFFDGAYNKNTEQLEFQAGGKKDKKKKKAEQKAEEARQRAGWVNGPPAKPAPRPRGPEQSRPVSRGDLAVPRPAAASTAVPVSNGRGWGASSSQNMQQPHPKTELPLASIPSAATPLTGPAHGGQRTWAERAMLPPKPHEVSEAASSPAVVSAAPLLGSVLPSVVAAPDDPISMPLPSGTPVLGISNGQHESKPMESASEPIAASEANEVVDRYPMSQPTTTQSPNFSSNQPTPQTGWGVNSADSVQQPPATLASSVPYQAEAPASSIYPAYGVSVSQASSSPPVSYAAGKGVDDTGFPTSASPTSLGNGTLNYGQSALSAAGYLSSLSNAGTAGRQSDIVPKFGSFAITSPANGTGTQSSDAENVPHETTPMVAHPATAAQLNFVPGAGMATGQYGFPPQYGGTFTGIAVSGDASVHAARQMQQAQTYSGEDVHYGHDYNPGTDPTTTETTRSYRGSGYRGGESKGGETKHPAPHQIPQMQHQLPPQHQPQQTMQAGQPQPMHYAYPQQQMTYTPQYMYAPQAAFYGAAYHQGFPAQAAQYSQQPNKMRPAVAQYSGFPAQGGAAYASYMPAVPATIGYEGYSYADGSYPVQDPPASTGSAASSSTDSKGSPQDLQQLSAAGYHNYAAAGVYPAANYQYAGAAYATTPQSAHLQQPAASLQQTYGQQPYAWQGGTPSQGSR